MFHPIADRIIAGEDVCMGEILQHNAKSIIDRERVRAARGPHDAKGCKVKNCSHNQGSDIPYAAVLAERAAVECSCGKHT